jgi:hypothetical protein
MAASPRWAVVDELVHELGSLRAVVQEVESQPGLADDDVTLELRASLGRAADTIHLVIGGNEGLVSRARRCIAEAREVSARARRVLESSRATNNSARSLRGETQVVKQAARAAIAQAQRQIDRAEQRIDDLKRTRRGAPSGAHEKRAKT